MLSGFVCGVRAAQVKSAQKLCLLEASYRVLLGVVVMWSSLFFASLSRMLTHFLFSLQSWFLGDDPQGCCCGELWIGEDVLDSAVFAWAIFEQQQTFHLS
jgi:hypothetical protein